MNVLDRNLNVQDSYLLEASAGTGKTFSIENIVSRLLIETDHPLFIDQILIVTFTKAATSDLKRRIRQNIEKTIRSLKNPETQDFKPDYIQAHIEKGENAINDAIFKLKNALFSFDEAQIFTIHSFCSKMVQDHIIEGGASLRNNETENSLLNSEVLDVIRNFFRTELTAKAFSKSQVNIVLKKHKAKIENVEKALIKWITGGLEIKKTDEFQDHYRKFCHLMQSFSYEKDKIIADFEQQIINYKKLKTNKDRLQLVTNFASLFEKKTVSEDDLDQLIEDGLYLLEALDKKQLKVKQKPLEKKLFYPNLIEDLNNRLLPLFKEVSCYENIFAGMAYKSQKLLQNYLKEEEKFRFDDLLIKMNEALKNEQFTNAVRERYKAAIIDEFQDTDQIQWNIFNKLFTNVSPIYLVGDPKQSIYAFRQADIYTYLKAASTIKEDHKLFLSTNFRSEPPLTACLNALFEKSVSPALIELPKLQTVLDFHPVKSPVGLKEYPFKDSIGSVHFFIAENGLTSNKFKIEGFEKYYFPFMAKEIQNLQDQGFELSQIAILVKDEFQAKRLSTYMQEKGIDLALQKLTNLSESSVVTSLIDCLTAIITPRDESSLKLALGGQLIGFSSQDILLLDDPLNLEEILDKFHYFKKSLYSCGFSTFFEIFLKSYWNNNCLAELILSRENGDDLYDELLQIGQLLSEHQSQTKASPDELLSFLKELDLLSFNSDDRMKKLKDPNKKAIKVLTIHSSKGLEFDLVFALGLVNRSPLPNTFIPVQVDGKTILEPLVDTHSKKYLDYCNEIDAEKLRQLYVAMTRAKHRLYIPVAFPLNGKEIVNASASCMELFLAKMKNFRNDESALYEDIQRLNCEEFMAFIDTFPKSLKFTYSKLNELSFSFDAKKKDPVILTCPPKIEIANESIFMNSFTKLSGSKTINPKLIKPPHDFLAEDNNRHTLPAGAKTGILLHSMLESFPFEKYGHIKTAAELNSFTYPFLAGTKFENWSTAFHEILFNLLNCTLDTFQFKEIDPHKIYREQEFIFQQPNVNGFMNGIIDMMFMHEGKYYFIDWKSNWLGATDADYDLEALKNAMIENNYYLQAEIYKEAISKFLKIVEKKDFDDCFGGIFYIFLRGVSASKNNLGLLHFK